MPGKYNKNFTENGYLMNYRKREDFLTHKNHVLQFRIELESIEPVIWRRILVPSDYNFWDLHVAIQDAMGWLDYHLHHFEIQGKGKHKTENIGIPDFEGFHGENYEVLPGWEIPVLPTFNELGVTARYFYDYGDNWIHHVMLEGYIFKHKKVKYPVCIGGEHACPPEDCGGVDSYYEILQILSKPENEEYESMLEWVGEDWDPEFFNRKNVSFDNPYKRWERAFFKGR